MLLLNYGILHTFLFVLCKHEHKKKYVVPSELNILSCVTVQTTTVLACTTRNKFEEIMNCLCTGWVWKKYEDITVKNVFMSSFHISYLKVGKLNTANYSEVLLQLQV